jgi:hypothetical protein
MNFIAAFYKISKCAYGIFDRSIRIEAMLVIQVYVIGAEAFERVFDRFFDVCRAGIKRDRFTGMVKEPGELGGNKDVFTAFAFECSAEEYFIFERAVHFGSISEVYADIEGAMKYSN